MSPPAARKRSKTTSTLHTFICVCSLLAWIGSVHTAVNKKDLQHDQRFSDNKTETFLKLKREKGVAIDSTWSERDIRPNKTTFPDVLASEVLKPEYRTEPSVRLRI